MAKCLVIAAGLLIAFAGMAKGDQDGFVDTFTVQAENFTSTGKNDYFILEPGYQHVYEGTEDGKPAKLIITVLEKTKKIDGVETRIVEERESAGGKLTEVSRNYFAVDKTNNDIYYFGEDVDIYKNGKVVDHEGAWQSGKEGAHYGLFMPAKPQVGQKYYQELAPDKVMDRFEVKSLSEAIKVPAGNFSACLKTEESSPLEPKVTEAKYYAPGVGLIIDGGLKLVKHGPKPEAKKGEKSTSRTGGDEAVVPLHVAREALADVGDDPRAEQVWMQAINDPLLTANERQDLIEDLNEDGFADPHHVTVEDLPLIINRISLIERIGPDAMDEVNAAAFSEAYKDLTNMYDKLAR
jgi:hypothetical protein